MNYLFKKLRRDLWQYRGQFLSVFVMTFLCLFIFSGLEGMWQAMSSNSQAYFKETHLADAWVATKSISDDQIKDIESLKMVEDLDVQVKVNGTVIDNESSAEFQIISPKNNNVSRLQVIRGRTYDRNSSGVWIDSFYAEAVHLKVGDNIKIEIGNKTKTEKINGIIRSSEYIGYTGSGTATPTNHSAYGYLVVGKKTFESLTGSKLSYNQLKLKLTSGADEKEVRRKLENILGSNMLAYTDRSNNQNIAYFTDKISSIQRVSVLFSAIFLLLALLTIYSTISRLVDSQRAQIGTLIAMGFSKAKILMHYLSYGTFISLFSASLGYICSFGFSQMMINSQKKFHEMPSWNIPLSFTSLLLIATITAVCSLAALMASYKLVVSNPALIMKNQGSMAKRSGRFAQLSFLSYEWLWVLRDAFRSKLRLFIGILAIFGSVVLVLSANGLKDSVDYSNQYVYGTLFSYKTKVNIAPSANKSEIEDLGKSKGQWLQEELAEVKVGDSVESINLMIVDKGDFINLTKTLNLTSEDMVVAKKLADRLNIKRGDRVSLKISQGDSYQKYRVSEIVDIPFPQAFYISKKVWEEADNEFVPTSYLVDYSVSKEENKGIESTSTLKQQMESTKEIMQSIYTIVIAMIITSVLLVLVILYNLGMLKFVEKSREYATLKVLGFRNGEIFKLVVYDSLPPLIVGCILGVLVGTRVMAIFVTLVGTNVRAYLPHLTLINLGLTLLIIIGSTLVVDYLIYRKIGKLSLVESLKASE